MFVEVQSLVAGYVFILCLFLKFLLRKINYSTTVKAKTGRSLLLLFHFVCVATASIKS